MDPLMVELHARFGRRLLKLCEVADFLSVGQSTVREWVADGDMECIKLSERAWRFRSQSIVDFVRNRDELNGGVAAMRPTNGGRKVSPLRPAAAPLPKKPKARRVAATA
jgi:excisionase family DNA binding protein